MRKYLSLLSKLALLKPILDELAGYSEAADKREYLISRVESLYETYIEPVDLPGPDEIIDPQIKAAIRPLVGRIYDVVLTKLGAPANA